MRRLRNRGPSGAELVRQTQVRRLLCRYGAYSRAVCSSKSASSLDYSSSSLAQSRSSKLAASSSSIQLASASARRAGRMLQEDSGDLKLAMTRPSQLLPSIDWGSMDKGLALAAAQYVSRILASGEADEMDAQQLKEDFLHQLERDWGFTGKECLSLGRIKITIKRRDDELENFRRRAEAERVELEKNRLMQERGAQLRTRVENVSSSSSHQSHHVQSTTKVVKTRVVKTVKRTVQTVRAA